MKKSLLALAVLGTFTGAAFAQSNVTIYGSVDQYLGYIKSDTGNKIISLNDGAILRTRLGFRGVEDMGNGYKAKFTLEQGLNGDSGGAADATRGFDRQSWVGMETPVGEFRAGRQNTAIFFIGGAIDYTDRTTYGSIINTFGVPSRYDNDLSFKSLRMANFQVEAHYAMTEIAGESVGKRGIYQLGVDYTNGPYRAGYAGLVARPTAATVTVSENIVYHNAYADYDYGQGKVYLAYVRSNNSTGNANGANAATILGNVGQTAGGFAGTDVKARRFYNIYQISADYRIAPALRIGALYGKMQDTTGGKAGADGGNIGAFYDLSKRTVLYSFASYMKNEANAGFRFSSSAGPASNLAGTDVNGKALTGLQIGMRHVF